MFAANHPAVIQRSHLLRPASPGSDGCQRSSPSAQPSRSSLALTKPGRLRRNPKPPAQPSVSPGQKFLVTSCRWAAIRAGSHLAGVEGELALEVPSSSGEGQGASAEPDGAEVGRGGRGPSGPSPAQRRAPLRVTSGCSEPSSALFLLLLNPVGPFGSKFQPLCPLLLIRGGRILTLAALPSLDEHQSYFPICHGSRGASLAATQKKKVLCLVRRWGIPPPHRPPAVNPPASREFTATG